MLTATTTGYRKELVTWSVCPRAAMIKANSPICTNEKPLWMELCRECPVMKKLRLPNIICPRVTASEMTSMGNQY